MAVAHPETWWYPAYHCRSHRRPGAWDLMVSMILDEIEPEETAACPLARAVAARLQRAARASAAWPDKLGGEVRQRISRDQAAAKKPFVALFNVVGSES